MSSRTTLCGPIAMIGLMSFTCFALSTNALSRAAPSKAFQLQLRSDQFSTIAATVRRNQQDEADLADVDYERDVKPILSRSCFPCHGENKRNRRGELRLDIPVDPTFESYATHDVIVIGDPNESDFIDRITVDHPDLVMPPPDFEHPLRKDEIETLMQWVVQGASYVSGNPTQLIDDIATGFEEFEPGPLRIAEDEAGSWQSEPSHADIHSQHSRSGENSLRLLGGQNREVIWTPRIIPANRPQSDDEAEFSHLSFWYERWTRREPFAFTVETFSQGAWRPIYQNDGSAVVGSFRNRVHIPIDAYVPEKFRFRSTSPENSGVMIDDIRLIRSRPMTIEDATVEYWTVPILLGNQINPVSRLRINTNGNLEPQTLQSLSLSGPDQWATNIRQIDVFRLNDGSALPWRDIESLTNVADRIGGIEFHSNAERESTVQLPLEAPLEAGTNDFVISICLNPDAPLESWTSLQIDSCLVDDEPITSLDSSTQNWRTGVAVRKAEQDGADAYRIPGLVTSNQGTLLAVYDIRYDGWGDLPGNIDVGLSRSIDGGTTWQPMQTIMDMGSDPDYSYDGIGDPAILVDETTGTIWVAATWSHGNRSWNGSGPGLSPSETGQLMLSRSDDDGQTWSEPINITSQVKQEDWSFLLQGPGRGITLADGTIAFAAQYRDSPSAQKLPYSTIIYSRDHGDTWQIGTGAFPDTTEAQVVELTPGNLMLNCRYNRESTRVVMTTSDFGMNWDVHPTSRRSLVEPRACMASLLAVPNESNGELPILLFCNPDSDSARERMTIKASLDLGLTWPEDLRLLIDELPSAGYSCLTMIDSETIGVLYEGSRAPMTFLRVPLSDLLPEIPSDTTSADAQQQADNSLQIPLTIDSVFGDHMVLQANRPIIVSGTAPADSFLSVIFAEQTRLIVTDSEGNWEVELEPCQPTFDPKTLLVSCLGKTIQVDDILVGEVWICAGQSNMEMSLKRVTTHEEDFAALSLPQVRLLSMTGRVRGESRSFRREELEYLNAGSFCEPTWHVATGDSLGEFSAIGSMFGKSLHQQLDVPIGLINVAAGGTPIEAWISHQAISDDALMSSLVSADWLSNPQLGEWCRARALQNLQHGIRNGWPIPGDESGPNHPFKPSFMWDACMSRLTQFPVRGVIWYQGESNAESEQEARLYRDLFPLMVADWRAHWKHPLPILTVQLPGMNREAWPVFRDIQRELANTIPLVWMAHTLDLGDPNDVHPRDKAPVADRLARLAKHYIYEPMSDGASTDVGLQIEQLESTNANGPNLQKIEFRDDQIVLKFENAAGGLISSDGLPIRYLEIANESLEFSTIEATIDQDSLIIDATGITAPKFVRYGWVGFPDPPVNLTNLAGLPASPFSVSIGN